jgi:urease alpha subunit
MNELDLKIVNGHLATTSGVFKGDIGVNGGRIASFRC